MLCKKNTAYIHCLNDDTLNKFKIAKYVKAETNHPGL